MPKPCDKIIFALDVRNEAQALAYVGELADHVGVFKVGLELFIGGGRELLGNLGKFCKPIMLDLKLHDIPETVERAVLRAGDLGVKFVTLHVQQHETITRAVRAAEKSGVQLLGVTVLTSMVEADVMDLAETIKPTDPSALAKMRAWMAWEWGLTGFVCSPQEVAAIRAAVGPKATLVTPGIRPAGSGSDDQKRVGTPAQAIADGADYIVVGRPIRDAPDPITAAKAIANEIAES